VPTKAKPPTPLCKTCVICRQFAEHPETKEPVLIGLPQGFMAPHYPAAYDLWLFARVASTHGDYRIQVQLQNVGGDVVWQGGPQEDWSMPNPMGTYDLKLQLLPVFPCPSKYDLVLLANGDEVARQSFETQLAVETPAEDCSR